MIDGSEIAYMAGATLRYLLVVGTCIACAGLAARPVRGRRG